jgi:hypothetical protein
MVEASRVRREVIAGKAPGDHLATPVGPCSSDIQRGVYPAASKMLVITGGRPGCQGEPSAMQLEARGKTSQVCSWSYSRANVGVPSY